MLLDASGSIMDIQHFKYRANSISWWMHVRWYLKEDQLLEQGGTEETGKEQTWWKWWEFCVILKSVQKIKGTEALSLHEFWNWQKQRPNESPETGKSFLYFKVSNPQCYAREHELRCNWRYPIDQEIWGHPEKTFRKKYGWHTAVS